MNDEEFKKKLESILGNLYRIDQEVREYLGREKLDVKNQEYMRRLSQRYKQESDEKYKN
jgi:hypothetical protein